MADINRAKSGNRALGYFGESAVVDFLTNRGSVIVDRNWRIREGEIDIVAELPDGKISFIEVKTRSSKIFGHPLEAINAEKAHRLQRLALAWLAMHQSFGREYQIDCVAVMVSPGGSFTIEYRENVL